MNKNRTRIAYDETNPNFVKTSSDFFTFATGSEWNALAVNIDTAGILNDVELSKYLNVLSDLPTQLTPSLGQLVQDPIPGIEPWTLAAAAYTQLARENPWYFFLRNSNFEIDEMTNRGMLIVALIDAIRERDKAGDPASDTSSELFDALIKKYRDALGEVQVLMDLEIEDEMPTLFGPPSVATSLNLWAQSLQLNAGALIGSSLGIFEGDDSLPDLPISNSGWSEPGQPYWGNGQGFNMWNYFPSHAEISLMQLWYLIHQANNPNVKPRYEITESGGNNDLKFYIGTEGQGYPRLYRDLEFQMDRYFQFGPESGAWIFLDNENSAGIANLFKTQWACLESNIGRHRNSFFPGIEDLTGSTLCREKYPDPLEVRIRVQTDSTDPNALTINEIQGARTELGLRTFREKIRGRLSGELKEVGSPLNLASKKLDNAESLIDAYVTIGMSRELDQSQVLRSALRAVSGGELGIRSEDLIALIDKFEADDPDYGWADPDRNVNFIETIFNARVDIIAAEIEQGLKQPGYAPNYVAWVLAELNQLRYENVNPAVDDTYVTDSNGAVTVVAIRNSSDVWDDGEPRDSLNCQRWLTGLFANDAEPACADISVDPGTGYPGYLAPTNGVVNIDADGSFTYTANIPFSGSDSFTYRAIVEIKEGLIVYSDPATVVITGKQVLPETIFASGFEVQVPE